MRSCCISQGARASALWQPSGVGWRGKWEGGSRGRRYMYTDGKVSVYQCRRPGFDPGVGKIPRRRKWQPTPVLLPRKSHGRRSLVQATVPGVAKSQTRLSDLTLSLSYG